MNYANGYFLAVYIGRKKIKAAAFRSIDGNPAGQRILETDAGNDPGKALDSLLDALEEQLGTRFTEAYLAGFFGGNDSKILIASAEFGRPKKITNADIRNLISKIPELKNPEMRAIHFIPVSYDTDSERNLLSPVGTWAARIGAKFFAVMAGREYVSGLGALVGGAYLSPRGAIDIMFAMGSIAGKSVLINLGASATRVAVSGANGLVYMAEIATGQSDLTLAIASRFDMAPSAAEKIKTRLSSAISRAGDQFEFIGEASAADIKELVMEFSRDLARALKRNITDNAPGEIPERIVLFGGGAAVEGIGNVFAEAFGRPVSILGKDAAMQSVGRLIFAQNRGEIEKFRQSFWRRFIRKIVLSLTNKKCPVYPSSLAFGDLPVPRLRAFEEAGITTIHYDYMDGEYVQAKAGSADAVKYIKAKSNLKVAAHLMARDPAAAVNKFIRAGADSIIVHADYIKNLAAVKQAGKKCGVAINPDEDISAVLPAIKHLDIVVVMSVQPGASGQSFMPEALNKVEKLRAIKKKARLKFEIVVDGGINPEAAKLCWKAGAD
ncbi:MAG: ribulose-phosphate 3-epimerase, partial [Rickettsiales bacterium]|nr:ribulose-phosphate 3-epimerase [Rickettsiales bacterium]